MQLRNDVVPFCKLEINIVSPYRENSFVSERGELTPSKQVFSFISPNAIGIVLFHIYSGFKSELSFERFIFFSRSGFQNFCFSKPFSFLFKCQQSRLLTC